jgi:AraC-like DNA-binding protein
MRFEFTADPSFNFVTSFAGKLQQPVQQDKLVIPARIGEGFIRKIDIEPGLKLVIHHYTLHEEFHLKRLAPQEKNDMVSIIFNSQEVPTHLTDKQHILHFLKTTDCAIQIASSSLGTETLFPAGSKVRFAVLGASAPFLSALLRIKQPNSLVATILDGKASFFYHECMTPDIERILKQLSEVSEQNELNHLYYRIQAQELLYRLFNKLLNRDTAQQRPVNKTDLESLYAVKAAIVADLSVPPRLGDLVRIAGMSETKMKQLFKQVFGETIYNYYQTARMEEAALLLRAGYSVTETGYKLGFSNLSHFSRLFEKHHGLTPKKFSVAG